jgi:hypothetical protein
MQQHEDELAGGAERQPWDRSSAAGEPRPLSAAEAARRDPGSIRSDDTEPYIGLQYVARLFKVVAFLVLIALILEIGLGLVTEGMDAVAPLLGEVVQLGVLAAILWGAADLTLLFIDIGHDVRAARVLLGRISSRGEAEFEGERRERKRV